MKVLYVSDTLGHGGSERQLVELLKGLDQREDVEYGLCLLSDRIHYDEGRTLGGQVWVLGRRPGFDRRMYPKLSKLCKEYRPDLIHPWDVLSPYYSMPIAKMLGIPVIASIRNAPNRLRLFDGRWVRTKISCMVGDYVVANSQAGLDAYFVSEKQGRCIHNGFDLGRVGGLEARSDVLERLNIQTESVVGMVGRFHPNKDNESFLRAAMNICSRRSDVTFVAVGDGRRLEYCKSLIPDGLRDRIRFLGRRSDVETLVNAFDIAVLATYAEGISNAIMEYMALAKPVVATMGGGTSELVLDGVTGFLVPPSDPESLARRIEFLLLNPGKAREMGNAGRKRIEEEFSIRKMSDSFVDTYRNILRPKE